MYESGYMILPQAVYPDDTFLVFCSSIGILLMYQIMRYDIRRQLKTFCTNHTCVSCLQLWRQMPNAATRCNNHLPFY